jgi:hypothetical protein
MIPFLLIFYRFINCLKPRLRHCSKQCCSAVQTCSSGQISWLPPSVSRTAAPRIDNSWKKNIHELAITRLAQTDAILVLTDREEQQTPSQKLSVIQNWFAEFKERKK